jgi:hypothetical protein
MGTPPSKSFAEKRAGYIEDTEKGAWPWRREAMDFVKESAAWGRLALQYSFVLNGGALVLLPHIAGQHDGISVSADTAAASTCWFVGGLIGAALCCAVAYINFLTHADERWSIAAYNMHDAAIVHFEDGTATDGATKGRELAKRIARWQWRTAIGGLVLGLGSYGCFAIGALKLLLR